MKQVKSRYARRQRINIDEMVSFNGIDQFADAGVNTNIRNAIDQNKNFSISVFCEIRSANQEFYENSAIVSMSGESGSNFRGFMLFQKQSTSDFRYIALSIYRNHIADNITFTAPFDLDVYAGKLVHVCVTYTPGIGAIFINGIKHTTETPSLSGNIYQDIENEPLRFGRSGGLLGSQNTRNWYDGFISNVSFFDKVLTDQEVKTIYHQGGVLPPSTHASCVAHYPMTQIEGDVIYDQVDQYNQDKPDIIQDTDVATIASSRQLNDQEEIGFVYNGERGVSVKIADTQTSINNAVLLGIYLSGNQYNTQIFNSGSNTVYQENSNLPNGTYCKVKRNGSSAEIYVAGVLQRSTTLSSFWFQVDSRIEDEKTPEFVLPENMDLVANTKTVKFYSGKRSFYNSFRLNPFHAKLRGYDDEEHTSSIQNTWKDFYTKEKTIKTAPLPRWSSHRLVDENNNRIDISSIDADLFSGGTQPFGALWQGVVIVNSNSHSGAGDVLFNFQNAHNLSADASFRNASLFRLRWGNGLFDFNLGFNIPQFAPKGTLLTVVLNYDGTDLNFRLYTDAGKFYEDTKPFSGYSNYQNNPLTIYSKPNRSRVRFSMWSNEIPSSDLDLIWNQVRKGSGIGFNQSVVDVHFNSSKRVATSSVGGHRFLNSVEHDEFIELDSIKPYINKGLRFDGSNDACITPTNDATNEEGYTIMLCFSMGINRSFEVNEFIVSQKDDSHTTSFSIYGNNDNDLNVFTRLSTSSRFERIEIKDTANIHEVAVTILGETAKIYLNGKFVKTFTCQNIDFSDIGGSMYIGSDDLENQTDRRFRGNIYRFALAKGIANSNQIKKMWNNGILSGPDYSWQNLDWQFYLDMNRIIDNSGTFEIHNYGNVSGNATLSGFSTDDLKNQTNSKIRTIKNVKLEKRYPAYYPRYYPKRV